MSRVEIDPNLLLFVDPSCCHPQESWRFMEEWSEEGEGLYRTGHNLVCRFARPRLHRFLLAFLKLRLKGLVGIRTVLSVNDGLLSCFFYAQGSDAYRAFARNHLPEARSLRQKIVSRLPLFLRAEAVFLVLSNDLPSGGSCANSDRDLVEAPDLMFFSNRLGKLLLLSCRTMRSGEGEIIKTTANPDYLPVMEKEFATLAAVSAKMGHCASLPQLGRDFELGGRHFFTEKYIMGESLRDVLNRYGNRRDTARACLILQSLDDWFTSYSGVFTGTPKTFSALTGHLIPLFSTCHPGADPMLCRIAAGHLASLDRAHPGLVPVVSHNDLWPGNFVLTEKGLIVIDWERATADRAPFFDYFWMIVSAALEYLVGEEGAHDYSRAFGRFVLAEDQVSREAHRKLCLFMKRLSLPETLFRGLLFLFLMEWSVQGYQALARQTDMDRMVFNELNRFAAAGITPDDTAGKTVASSADSGRMTCTQTL